MFRESRCELLFQGALGTDGTGGDGGDSAAVGRRGCRVSGRGRRCALMEGASTVYAHWEAKKISPARPNESQNNKRKERKDIRIIALALFKDAGFVVAGHVLYSMFRERERVMRNLKGMGE